MLHRAGDAAGNIEDRAHGFSGLAHLMIAVDLPHINHCPRSAAPRPPASPSGSSAQIGATEELDRVAVLVRPLSHMHLPQICGKLGLLVASAGYIFVRGDHLAPGLEVACGRALDCGASTLAFLAAHLLVKAQSQETPPSSSQYHRPGVPR